MDPVKLILVGGFLGAGKTTLLAQAAERFAAAGQRVGLVTNDQAARLVDTAVLRRAGGPEVKEVSGGCFCCRFDDLIAATDELIREHQPNVIIGEPVGSCTDLSATVLQPLKEAYGDRFRVAPFSVLVDVRQMRSLNRLWQSLRDDTASRFPNDVLYIYRKQLEEADLIVLNKIDLVSDDEAARLETVLRENFPGAERVAVSARTGRGVAAWLEIVSRDGPAGQRIAEVDYDTYAQGEAALAWLNASFQLRAPTPQDWHAFCRRFLLDLQARCREAGAEIAHVKTQLASDSQTTTGNLVNNADPPTVADGAEHRSREVAMLLNARVLTTPEDLRAVVEGSLQTTTGAAIRVATESLESFSPARPTPVHRFKSVQ